MASTDKVVLAAPTTVIYTLTSGDPANTSLADRSTSSRDVKPAYTVHTAGAWTSVTTVKNGEGVPIATLKWNEVLSDKVTIRDGPSVSIDSWMKSGVGPIHTGTASFHDDQGRKYHWKNISVGCDMELHAEDTPGGPIAAYRRPRINLVAKTSAPATFSMTARAQEIEETCVVSFLFLEKRRRSWENAAEKQGAVVGPSPLGDSVSMSNGMESSI